ncbi:hypothetical protein HIM_02588 [Hirsutella minnesotensis 3608]|nr:hypothetical protein HIM_02588 [Hirsutella minnesotensis 3608]
MKTRNIFTTITPLPAGMSRELVVDMLHNHVEMIDLNPLVTERHRIDAPAHAAPEERGCAWYSITDRVAHWPANVSYTCAFHDLERGLQTHCHAPLGVEIRETWSVGGALPGEPREPVELGVDAPASGLYLREDVDLRCNFVMAGFVKKTLKKAHAELVQHLAAKARQQQQMKVQSGDAVSPHAGVYHAYNPTEQPARAELE